MDLIPTNIFIEPGNKSNTIVNEQTVRFHFNYDIIKVSATDPSQFKFLAVISLDGDIKNPTNRNMTDEEHSVNKERQAMCMFCVLYILCVEIHLFCVFNP